MKKERFLIILSCWLVFNLFQCSDSANIDVPPNIIVIVSDDQGWGDLSIQGNQNLQTPHIDRLGQEGALLSRFYVSPVCSPTRAEFLTGRYHLRMGVTGTSAGSERMDYSETSIGEVFQQAGYSTALFGKWHNGMQYPYHPNARGFDEFYGFCSGHWGHYFSPMLEHNGEIVRGNGYLTDDFTDHAIDFIESNADNPFLLYLAYNTPHSPMQVPDQWWNKINAKELTQLADVPEDEAYTKAALAMCENIDWNVGRILSELESRKLEQNTIVVYFSDNGPNTFRWNNGLKGRKGSIDEGGVRSPLLIRYPGVIPQGQKVNTMAGAIDLLPTLMDFAKIDNDIPKPLDGISLKNSLIHSEKMEDRYLFSAWKKQSSVRNQQYLFTYQNELFDIEKDPGQKINLASIESEIRDRMASKLEEWEREVGKNEMEKFRPFTIGHPLQKSTQLPARDGIPHGNIQRSNQYPNSSFFTNWISTTDKITWEVDVLQSGLYEVDLYYTCAQEDVGSVLSLRLNKDSLSVVVDQAHDPPLLGMAEDRIVRAESYTKEFRKMSMGELYLDSQTGVLELKVIEKPGNRVIDFSSLILNRK